ncbi:hypothetical protein BT69DRAFT_1279750 [Atractiella rhizophila]|nr:hypothetical protein BT69DRAFT_1279750 [Atractiella rhizophila]
MGCDNPAAIAVEEAKRIWGPNCEIAGLVSFGSGAAPRCQVGQCRASIEGIGADCSRF